MDVSDVRINNGQYMEGRACDVLVRTSLLCCGRLLGTLSTSVVAHTEVRFSSILHSSGIVYSLKFASFPPKGKHRR